MRKFVLAPMALLLVLWTTVDQRAPKPIPRQSLPNILFILTDDQRYDELDHMPNVQAMLMANGVNFSNGFVSDSLCCPSRATILTGTYSHTNGIYRNQGPNGGFAHFNDATTIATILHAAGYHTGLIGKYLNGYQTASYIPPGWDRWFAQIGKKGGGGEGGGYYDYSVSDQGTEVAYDSASSDYSTDVLASQALDFINTAPESQPFFLYWAPHAPHEPFTPAPKYANTFDSSIVHHNPNYNELDVSDKPAYVQARPLWSTKEQDRFTGYHLNQYRTLLSVDDAVGQFMQALSSLGRLSNTLIIYMGDNGLMDGEHRLSGKLDPYEESIRVPFIVRWDALGIPPRDDSHLAVNIDVAPTFADAAGTTMPGAEGQSLLPLLTNPTASWRSEFLIEHLGEPTSPTYCGVRSTGFTYVQYGTGEEELYDILADPYELQNVARDPQYATTLHDMRAEDHVLCDPVPPGFTWKH